MLEKKALSPEVLEAQTAMELPDREMMALVVINNVLSGNTITVDIRNVDVALQVCANALSNNPNLTCEVVQ